MSDKTLQQRLRDREGDNDDDLIDAAADALDALEKRITALEWALRETLTTLDHARVFISCREKMHPVGQELYDENRTAIRALLGEK